MSRPDKQYPMWQLMDGTVVIQAPKDPSARLKAGPIAWFEQHGLAATPTSWQRVRHQVLRFLERI